MISNNVLLLRHRQIVLLSQGYFMACLIHIPHSHPPTLNSFYSPMNPVPWQLESATLHKYRYQYTVFVPHSKMTGKYMSSFCCLVMTGKVKKRVKIASAMFNGNYCKCHLARAEKGGQPVPSNVYLWARNQCRLCRAWYILWPGHREKNASTQKFPSPICISLGKTPEWDSASVFDQGEVLVALSGL